MGDYLLGLDLGKTNDFTALSVVRRSMRLTPAGLPQRDHRDRLMFDFAVVHAKRYPRGTPYPEIVLDLKDRILPRPELQPSPRLIVDATGVGNAVVDLFLAARLPNELIPLTITGGDSWRHAPWPGGRVRAWWVAKHQLCSATLAALESGQLKISAIPHDPGALDPAKLLKDELKAFRVLRTKAANETYSSREGEHDDLLLSVAMPVFLGGLRQLPYPTEGPPAVGRDQTVLDLERQAEAAALAADTRRREEAERQELEEADRRRRRNCLDESWGWT